MKFLDTNGLTYFYNKLKLTMEPKKLVFTNILVANSAFIVDSTYTIYPYRASITLSNVTYNMIPEIIFDIDDVTSGIFAPICLTYDGGVYIYSLSIPADNITIPTIICSAGV